MPSSSDTCQMGTFALGNSTACQPCSLGSYTSSMGSSTCFQCPRNFYAPLIGLSSCFECPNKMYTTSEGSTSFDQCLPQICSLYDYSVSLNDSTIYFDNSNKKLSFLDAAYECSSSYHNGYLPVIQSQTLFDNFPLYRVN